MGGQGPIDNPKDVDVGKYFGEYNPSPRQLSELKKLIKKGNKWWGFDYDEFTIQKAAFILAPPEFSRISPAAFDLLKRCQNRVKSFYPGAKDLWNSSYDYPHKETYGQLFDLLLTEQLIYEVNIPEKLKGGKTIPELRILLKERGLPINGKKGILIDRLIDALTPEELEEQVTNIFLYRTAERGDQAIEALQEHYNRVRTNFFDAVQRMREYLDDQKPPTPKLPPKILADIISQEEWEQLPETSSPRNAVNLESTSKKSTLTIETVENIINAIEQGADGFLTIAIGDGSEVEFVQTSYIEENKYYVDSNGRPEQLSQLGFERPDREMNPYKYVTRDQVTHCLIETLRVAFGIDLGSPVEFSYEIAVK